MLREGVTHHRRSRQTAQIAYLCALALGVFPSPIYDLMTRRPYFTEELREPCLDVRRTNRGVNGRTTLFYAQRRPASVRPDRKAAAPKPSDNEPAELLDGLRAAPGLTTATSSQVKAALKQVFPRGTDGHDDGEVIRAVFLRLKGQGSAA